MAFKKLKLWFDKELAQELVLKIKASGGTIDETIFLNKLQSKLNSLELKDRVAYISKRLNESIPGNYPSKLKTLISILGPDNKEETGMFKNYYWIMPIAKFVEDHGLDHFKESMKAIEEITKRNTGEYCIRPFLVEFPKKTLVQIAKWSKHKNRHVRRLASEGIRPRLPWAPKIQQFIDDPRPLLPILNALKDDLSKYVQKSVANCLNDIVKDNPAIAKETIENWVKDATSNRKWIIKHALRGLLKKEDDWARSIIGLIDKNPNHPN